MTLVFVDIAIAVLVCEAIYLLVTKPGPRAAYLWMIVAGAGLIGALHAALSGAPALFVIAGLAIGGVGHVCDLATRLRAKA